MNTLDQICIKHGTDKATVHPVKGHGYAPTYEHFFFEIGGVGKLLEIGVGGGESIRAWLDFLPLCKIVGVDIVQNTNDWNSPGTSPDPRYSFSHGDQTDRTMWKCFLANHGTDWDVIIDDGGHMADQVITTFEELWPHVKNGGIYCIEDLAVADDPGTIFVPSGWPNHLDWIRSKLVEINRDSDIEALHYVRELAVFRKK